MVAQFFVDYCNRCLQLKKGRINAKKYFLPIQPEKESVNNNEIDVESNATKNKKADNDTRDLIRLISTFSFIFRIRTS